MSAVEPFVGPVSLDAVHPVYGRDAELTELYGLVMSRRIVLLHAPSGAGKSSLLNAGTRVAKKAGERVPVGLIARLETKRLRCLGPMRVGNPAADDVESLRTSPGLERDRTPNRYTISAITSLESLRKTPALSPEEVVHLRLGEYLDRVTEAEQDYVLVFDQFEEILTSDPNDVDERVAFFKQLGAVLVEPRWRAVVAMRSDFIGALDPYVAYVPDRLSCRFYLDLFTEENARTAIIAPAERSGLAITSDAATKLIDELRQIRVQRPNAPEPERIAGRYVEPVHLQLIGRRIWQKRSADKTTLDVADVGDLGDVDAALGDYYDECIKAVSGLGTSELVIREWIQTMLINGQGIRGQILKDANTGLPTEIIDQLVNKFLLRQEDRRNATWIELSHDRLIVPILERNQRAEASFGDVKGAVGDFYNRCVAAAVIRKFSAADIRRWIEETLIGPGDTRALVQRGPEYTAGMPDKVIKTLVETKLLRQHVRGGVTLVELGQQSWIEPIRERNRLSKQLRNRRLLSRIAFAAVVFGISTGAGTLAYQRSRGDSGHSLSKELNNATYVGQASANLVSGRPLSALAWLDAAAHNDVDTPAVRTMMHEVRRNLWTGYYQQRSAITALQYLPDGKMLSIDDAGLRHLDTDPAGPAKPPARATAISKSGTVAVIDPDGELLIDGQPVPELQQHNLSTLTFSDDGKRLAVASTAAFEILDQHGTPLTPFLIAQGKISSLAFSPNGNLLAIRYKYRVELQRAADISADAIVVDPGGGEITSVSFSPDGCRLALATTLGYLVVTNVFGEELLRQAVPDIARVAFGPNPSTLATTTQTGSAQLWSLVHDAGQGLLLRAATRPLTLDGGTSAGVSSATVAAVAALSESASPSGHSTGSDVGSGNGSGSAAGPNDAGLPADATARSPSLAAMPDGDIAHRQGVLAWSSDGSTLLVAGPGRTGVLWNVADGNPLVTFEETANISAAVISPDASSVVLGTQAGTVRTWDARYGSKVEELRKPHPVVTDDSRVPDPSVLAAWSPSGSSVVTATATCQLNAWSSDGDWVASVIRPGLPSAVAFVDESHVIIACDRTYVWNLDSGTADELADVPGAKVVFARDARRFVTVTPQDSTRLWEYADGRVRQLASFAPALTAALDANGTHVASVAPTHIATWNADGSAIKELPLPLPPSEIIYVPGGADEMPRIAYGTGDKVAIWDQNGEPKAWSLQGSELTWLEAAPDGTRTIVGTDDGHAAVLDSRSVLPTTNALKLGANLADADVSGDSSRIATGTQEGALQLWDVATGHPVSIPQVILGGVGAVSFAPDGTKVLVAGPDGVARIYDTALDNDAPDAWEETAHRCSPYELQGTKLLVPRDAKGCAAQDRSSVRDRVIQRRNLLYAAMRALPSRPDLSRAYTAQLRTLTEKDLAAKPLEQILDASNVDELNNYLGSGSSTLEERDLDSLVSLTTSYHRPDLTLEIYRRQPTSDFVRLKVAEGELLTHDYKAAEHDGAVFDSRVKGYVLIARAIRWTSVLGEHRTAAEVKSAACDLRTAYEAWASQPGTTKPLGWKWAGVRNMLDLAAHDSAIMKQVEEVFGALQGEPHKGALDGICSRGVSQ